MKSGALFDALVQYSGGSKVQYSSDEYNNNNNVVMRGRLAMLLFEMCRLLDFTQFLLVGESTDCTTYKNIVHFTRLNYC